MDHFSAYHNKPVHSILNAGGFELDLRTPFFFSVSRVAGEELQSLLVYNCPVNETADTEVLFFFPLQNKTLNRQQFVNLFLSQSMASEPAENFAPFFSQECLQLKPVTRNKILPIFLNLKPVERSSLPGWLNPDLKLVLALAALDNPFFTTVYFNGHGKSTMLAVPLRDMSGSIVNALYFSGSAFVSRTGIPSWWMLNTKMQNPAISYVVFNPIELFSLFESSPPESSQAFCFFNPDSKIVSRLPMAKDNSSPTVLYLSNKHDQLVSCFNFLSAISSCSFSGYRLGFYISGSFCHLSILLPEGAVETELMQPVFDTNIDLAGGTDLSVPLDLNRINILPFDHQNRIFTVNFFNSPFILYSLLCKIRFFPFFPVNLDIKFTDQQS
jgi:hypothetical protein